MASRTSLTDSELEQGALGPLLRSGGRVALVFLVCISILVFGMRNTSVVYNSPLFLSAYLPYELAVGFLTVAVLATVRHRALVGWCRIRLRSFGWLILPLLALGLVIAAAIQTGSQLPATAEVNTGVVARTAATSLTVGFVEEVLFRGFLLAALTRAWGFRKAAVVSTLCFGAVHALNIFGGAPVSGVAIQLLSTLVTGAMLLLAALATRSLLLPIVIHGVWDFVTFLTNYFVALGAPASPLPVLSVFLNLIATLVVIRVVRRWDGRPAYGPYPAPSEQRGLSA